MEAFEQQCLLSYSTNRSGEVIKKYDFPTLPPYDETQKEDKMVHMMNKAIGQAFINHAPIMANSIHNAVLKTLQDGVLLGFVGQAYQQASQMVFAPTGSATATPPINPQNQSKGSIRVSQPIGTTVLPQFAPMFTSSTPMATHAHGGFMTGFPTGWPNLKTPRRLHRQRLQLHQPAPTGPTNVSASGPASHQQNLSVFTTKPAQGFP